MDIFENVGQSDPEGALKLFRKHSQLSVSRDNIGNGLYQVYKNLRFEEKQEFLLELAEMHPDRKLMEIAYGSEESDPSDNYMQSGKCNCQHCQIALSHVIGTHAVSANGIDAVNHYMSSGEVQNVVALSANGLNQEIQTIKANDTVKNLLNDRIFKLVTMGVLAVLVYKVVTSK